MDAVVAIADVGTLSIIFRLSLGRAKPGVKTAETSSQVMRNGNLVVSRTWGPPKWIKMAWF